MACSKQVSCVFIANSCSPEKPGLKTVREEKNAFSKKNPAQFCKSLRMCREFLLSLMCKQCTPPWCCCLDSWKGSGSARPCAASWWKGTNRATQLTLCIWPFPSPQASVGKGHVLLQESIFSNSLADKTHRQIYTVIETSETRRNRNSQMLKLPCFSHGQHIWEGPMNSLCYEIPSGWDIKT